MQDFGKAMTYLIYVGQLGLDLVTPVLLCLAGSWYLNTHFGWGMWIYFVGFFLGLGGSGVTFWKFYKRVVMKGYKKPNKKRRIQSYSRHY